MSVIAVFSCRLLSARMTFVTRPVPPCLLSWPQLASADFFRFFRDLCLAFTPVSRLLAGFSGSFKQVVSPSPLFLLLSPCKLSLGGLLSLFASSISVFSWLVFPPNLPVLHNLLPVCFPFILVSGFLNSSSRFRSCCVRCLPFFAMALALDNEVDVVVLCPISLSGSPPWGSRVGARRAPSSRSFGFTGPSPGDRIRPPTPLLRA